VVVGSSRYSRQIPLLGEEGQERLRRSTALVVGAGGLGSAVLYYLVAAGVGRVVVVDRGYVDLPDLNRQVLYTEEDLGRPKVEAAVARLRKLNSEVEVVGYRVDVEDAVLEELVAGSDVVVDCLDNWRARLRVNELVVRYSKPLVHAGIEGFYAQLTTVVPGATPCLACLVPRPPERSGTVPVVGFTPAVAGSIEAAEAVKILAGLQPGLAGYLLIVDLKSVEFTKIPISRRENCPVCSSLAGPGGPRRPQHPGEVGTP